jgi:dipeptidase E
MSTSPSNGKRLLLISNSTLHGSTYLDHAESQIRAALGQVMRILFVPYALHDRNSYAAQARARFLKMDCSLESIHEAEDPKLAINDAEAIFVGGGNTFRLLNQLQSLDLLTPIRKRVDAGALYIGSSAGSVISAPTIKTTNDMPIVQPRSFESLGLINFQINAHYLDPDPNSRHMGETREERLIQFLEDNETPVVGLREGCMIWVENGVHLLQGRTNARIFRRGFAPVEMEPGSTLDSILNETKS